MVFKHVFSQIRRALAGAFYTMSFRSIMAAVLAYGCSCYLLLLIAGEHHLLQPDTFIYYLIVTGSTVGYGDYGPTTIAGKWIVTVWVIPMGITLFALLLTRIGIYLTDYQAKGKRGLRMQNLSNHVVVIGWNGARTLRLIELLLAKANQHKEELVLCAIQEMENPLPKQIKFVKVDSFSHPEGMARANINAANRIIIDTLHDDVTLTTALYCAKENPHCHKAAYLQDESLIDLLRVHCPKVEIVPSVAIEMLARSALDPQSSQVHKQLLDSTDGMTQYRCQYSPPVPTQTVIFADIFNAMKLKHNATVIGLHRADENKIQLNPNLDATINSGDGIYYIANHRLTEQQCFEQSD